MLTQALRDEHAELLPHVEALRIAADAIGDSSATELAAKVRGGGGVPDRSSHPSREGGRRRALPIIDTLRGARGDADDEP